MDRRQLAWMPILLLTLGASPAGQAIRSSPPPSPPADPAQPPRVERLDAHRLRVDEIVVDQHARELSLEGRVIGAPVLEYLATSVGGIKSYETALELRASATAFNLALILLGLDQENGSPSRAKFDPEPPGGDPLELWVEWGDREGDQRRRAEELLWNAETERTLAPGPWVYTGSVFLPDGRYLAELDDVLIGFMHTPESIVDSPRPLESGYGAYTLNPELGLEAGDPVRLVLRPAAESS